MIPSLPSNRRQCEEEGIDSRHWDTWRTPGKVWTIGAIQLDLEDTPKVAPVKGHDSPFINLLYGTSLISKMDPHGSNSISKSHLAFTVKPPHLNYATHTREDVYLVPLQLGDQVRRSIKHLTPHDHGAISSVKFSPDGKKLVWLEMNEDGYESDKRVIVVHTLADKGAGESVKWVEKWDRSPSSVEVSSLSFTLFRAPLSSDSLQWAVDSESLYFIAEHHGNILPYHLTHPDHLPTPLIFKHSTGSITPLSDTSVLLSISSFTSPADTYLLDLSPVEGQGDDDADKSPNRTLHALTQWSKKHINGRLDGLEVEELWTKGADDWDVHSWIIKPSPSHTLTRGKDGKLPLAFFVHGGPQGAWEDSWSTRWNPALFAANGYFVVAVNPTGSTGYGQEFCDKIKQNWGGGPFRDLLASYQAALEKYDEVGQGVCARLMKDRPGKNGYAWSELWWLHG